MEVSEAFASEAWATLEAGDVGHGREVVAQQLPSAGAQSQTAVADTGWSGLGW